MSWSFFQVPGPSDQLAFKTASGLPLRGISAYRPGGHPDTDNNTTFNATPYDVFGNVVDQVPTARRQYFVTEGLNHVRASYNLGPVMQLLENSNQAGATALYAKILDDVTLYVNDGLMVIIDNHTSNFGQDLIPGYSNREVTTGPSGAKYLTYKTAITQLAAALHARSATLPPTKVALELMNEPPDASNITGSAWEVQQPITYAAVRAVMPNHTIVLTGRQFSRVETLIVLNVSDYGNDPNTIFTFHPYDPQIFTLQPGMTGQLTYPPDPTQQAAFTAANPGFLSDLNTYFNTPQNKAWIKSTWIDPIQTWRLAQGINANRIWAGEFGAADQNATASRQQFNMDIVDLCEAAGFGWNCFALNTTGQDLCPDYPPGGTGHLFSWVVTALHLA